MRRVCHAGYSATGAVGYGRSGVAGDRAEVTEATYAGWLPESASATDSVGAVRSNAATRCTSSRRVGCCMARCSSPSAYSDSDRPARIAAKIAARSGALVGLETLAVWLYYEGTAPYAEINGKDKCVFDQPDDRGDDIKNWIPVEKSVDTTETVGKVRHIRNAIVRYCQEEE